MECINTDCLLSFISDIRRKFVDDIYDQLSCLVMWHTLIEGKSLKIAIFLCYFLSSDLIWNRCERVSFFCYSIYSLCLILFSLTRNYLFFSRKHYKEKNWFLNLKQSYKNLVLRIIMQSAKKIILLNHL